MLFKPEHVKLIETDFKTATRRIWKRPHAKVGGSYPVQTRMFQPKKECLYFIRPIKIYRQRLGDMTEKDADKEGGYTLDEFKDVWIEINKKWDDDLEVTVIEW